MSLKATGTIRLPSRHWFNGGSGEDTLVISIDGDPTKEEDLPKFDKFSNTITRVSYNNKTLLAKNIEKIIVTDKEGNIGSVFQVLS